MEIRDPEADEAERIRTVVDSSMTASVRLSPEQIDGITDDQFAEDDRRIEVVDESLVKYVYTAADTDVDLPTASKAAESDREGDAADEAFPGTETTDGQLTVTDGGETVYVARDEAESGTAASFFVTYEDAAHADQYGFYCSNCGSLDVSMGERDRLECAECGNAHAERSEQSDDDSYL